MTNRHTFLDWIHTEEGAAVYRRFVNLALALRYRGVARHSADGIAHAIRFETAQATGRAVQINNTYVSAMARRAMEERDELRDFFETRRSAFDAAANQPTDYSISPAA